MDLASCNLERGDHMTNPYPDPFAKVTLAPDRIGPWSVETFSVTASQVAMTNLRAIRDGLPKRVIPPGFYTRLVCDRQIIMSDTPAEAHEHVRAYRGATGHVLIAGLGLGLCLNAILTKNCVKRVTVIERSPEVIHMVGRHITDPRVKIVNADINSWTAPRRSLFDFAWYDIWPVALDEDSVYQAKDLVRRFSQVTLKQDYWSREYIYM